MTATLTRISRYSALALLLSLVLAACGGKTEPSASAPEAATVAEAAASPAAMDQSAFDLPGVATPVPPRPEIAGVVFFDVASRAHTDEAVTYDQSPPVGGAHAPAWQSCAYYEAAIPNERAVHSMEHGAVWITYNANLANPDRKILKSLAKNNPFVLVSEYPAQDSPIVLNAWGAQLPLDHADDDRLQAFVDFYADNGPEKAPCVDGGSTEVATS